MKEELWFQFLGELRELNVKFQRTDHSLLFHLEASCLCDGRYFNSAFLDHTS